MTLVLPYRSLEPVVDQLDRSHYHENASADDPALIQSALGHVQVTLRAEVGAKEMTVESLLGLKAGDVLRLPERAENGVVLHVGEQAAYHATHGQHAGKRAVQIDGPVKDFR